MSLLACCFTSTETIGLIRDGRRWRMREIIYLSLHCYQQNDSCIKMGSDDSHFNVSLTVRDKIQTHERFKRTFIYYDIDTQSAHFRGDPLRQATKGHLNNSSTVKNDEILDEKGNNLSSVWMIC